MTTQAMPHEPSLKMAEMSDEKLADFFFAKVFTDDEPAGEPPTIPKERWQLTPTELEFIRAAASPAQRQRKGGRTMVDRWTGICDIDRMAELVRREPALLQSVGPLLIRATVSMHGCAPSTKFLLDHGVPLIVSETGYNCLHEAVWTGTCIENLRYVFESGAADAAGVSILKPHTGWPDNISLLYWAAASRDGAALTKLLLQFGADPEVRFKGNGERGNTALQEAVAPGGSEWMRGKRQTARVLRTDRVGRALRRALRLRLGRPRSRARMRSRLRPSLVCGRSGYDAPALGRPSRGAHLCGMAARTRCRRQRCDGK